MTPTLINGKWTVNLPDHRARLTEWVDGWEPERLDALHATIRYLCTTLPDGCRMLRQPPPVVFDIGAEQGDLTALYGRWGARVVAFEPNPLVWPNIRAIWEANVATPIAGHFVGFASNDTREHPEQIEPVIDRPDSYGWPACAYGDVTEHHDFRNVTERHHDTPQIRIDDFCATRYVWPDVLTIDVEGSELETLRGAERTLTERHPTVFVSIHPEFMYANYGYYEHDLHKYLRDLGYVGEWLAYDHEHHWKFTFQRAGGR